MSVIWGGGGSTGKVDFMRMLWWGLVVYEGVVGAASLLAGSSTNSTTQTISGLPSVGSLLNSSLGVSVGGIGDLAVAGGIWFFALR